eukprot:8435131-Pyramimonas_sp.AAC.1
MTSKRREPAEREAKEQPSHEDEFVHPQEQLGHALLLVGHTANTKQIHTVKAAKKAAGKDSHITHFQRRI